MYILSPIANTVLRNTTGYFSFHYRRYFRTPPLSCPITLSGTLPISSAMSTGRDDQALITSPCIFYPSVQRKPPLYFAQQNTGGRGWGVYLPFSSAPMLFKTTRHVAEYGRGRGLKSTFNILNSSIAVPRSITGCGVSNRGGVTKWRRGWKRHRISLFIPDISLFPLPCPVALRVVLQRKI